MGGSVAPEAQYDGFRVTDDDSDRDPVPRRSRIAEIAADPDAVRWALDCAWVPGTGHCQNRPCSTDCLFREQRVTEASRIEHARRQRRREQQAFAARITRLN